MRRGAVLAMSCLGLSCVAAISASTPVVAGPRRPDATFRFDIAAQPLGRALNQLALRSDREILFSTALTQGRRSASLNGVFTAEEALARLLQGSGLDVRLDGQSF